jgi:serine/threonine protein phosphatase 1
MEALVTLEIRAHLFKSQTHEGWPLIRSRYDDGGFSGGSIERPALQKLDNGGDAMLASHHQTAAEFASVGLLDRGHADWIRSLPLYFQYEHRIFVHAGVDPNVPLNKQSRETLLWKRYGAGVDQGFGARHVVHGHNPFEDGPLLLADRSDFDTDAFFSGRLVVRVFDDAAPGGPVELIERLS